MKKLTSVLTALALASSGIAMAPSAMAKDGNSDTVELCKTIGGGFDNLGKCISQPRKGAVAFCKSDHPIVVYLYSIGFFKNIGDCVSYIRDNQNQ